jgi:macrolide transport system ATP-binding/permease protein
MGKLWRRVNYVLRRNRLDAELAEEMEYHRSLAQRELGGDGAAANRAMGNVTLAREDARAVWIVPWLQSIWQDLVYGFRGMRRQPGFTLVALAVLGTAIGLNTSLFTAFNAIALRPWAVKDPASVVNVSRLTQFGPERGSANGFAIAEYRYLAERSKTFRGLIVMREGKRVQIGQQPYNLSYVSGNYFSVLDVSMERGRGFLPEEDRTGAPQAVVVLDYRTWQNRFGGDPAILGKTVRLDEVPFTVVGVASRGFLGTQPGGGTDLWTPFPALALLRPQDPSVMGFLTSPNHCCSDVAGRLAPGYTRQQAAAELDLLVSQFEGKSGKARDTSLRITGTALADSPDRKREEVVPIVGLLFLAITLVLLLACANVGNLLLARAAARRSEIAVRLALGGSRVRLIRQLLVESMALAGCAAAIGLAMAWTLPSYIVHRMTSDIGMELAPDLRVVAYTAALAVVACLAFGLAPALHGTRGDIAGALKTGSPLAARLSLRGVLLAAQVAISVTLLAGAGLLVRGLGRAQHQDPGFRVENVTVVRLDLPASAYGGARTKAFARQLQTDLESAGGLPTLGLTMDAPMANSRSWTNFNLSGEREKQRMVQFHEVTSGYFDVLGIPVVAGRNFVSEDFGRNVAMVNETAAKANWPGQNPVGKTFEQDVKTWEVVGVARDAYTTDLNTVQPTLYWPMSGSFDAPQVLVAGGGPAVQRIAAVVTRIEPRVQVRSAPLADNFQEQLAPARYGAVLAGVLGVLALALTSIGMSGVFAYVVRQRTREIGVRMALGAQPWQVVRLVLASNLRALVVGLAVGLAGAAAMSGVLVHQVSQVRPVDPAAYAAVFVLLIVAAAAASAFPARRAARVDPVRALRWE